MSTMQRCRTALTRAAVCAGLLILPGVGAVHAQTRLLVGTVRDSTGVPIPAAAVSIGAEVVRTDDDGTFVIPLPAADSITVVVRRIGFESLTFALAMQEAVGNDLDVVLNHLARHLSAVEIEEMELRAQTILRHFDERRAKGLGVYVAREEIEQRNASSVIDLLRGRRGVTVDKGALRFARQGSRACTPDVYVDGQFAPGLGINSVMPQDLEGIELYSGISNIPAEFMRAGRFNCGAIVFWTRRPILILSKQQQQKQP